MNGRNKSILRILIGFLLCAFAAHQLFAAVTVVTIADDATGGDCTTYGTWDQPSKTCVLTQSLITARVVIADDGITLDCDGYMIQGEKFASGPNDDVGVSQQDDEDHVTIKGCHIKNFESGIIFRDSEYNRFLNNRIEDIFTDGDFGSCGSQDSCCPSGFGICIDDDNDLIKNNVLAYQSSGNGIQLDFIKRHGTGNTITHNKLLYNDVTNSIDVDCEEQGDATDTLIAHNLIQGNDSNDGIEVSDQECEGIDIVHNTIQKSFSQDCIELEGRYHEVLYNLCQFTADEALEMDASDSTVKGNRFIRGTAEEIIDDTCDPGDEEQNAAIEIECGSNDNEFLDNIIVNDACGSGILFEGSSGCEADRNLIEGNRIYGSFFNGIYVLNPDATDNEIIGNTIYKNDLDGIRNAGTDTVIEDNIIRNNGEWGIRDEGTGTSISGNKGKGGNEGICTGAGCP